MKWTLVFAAAAPVLLASPAVAQAHHPGMEMPPAATARPVAPPKPATQPQIDHGAMGQAPARTPARPAPPAPRRTAAPTVDHRAMGHGANDQAATPAEKPAEAGTSPAPVMSGMDHSAMAAVPAEVGNEPPPEAPTDHAAEQFYGASQMATSRAQLRREHGGAVVSKVMLNYAEASFGEGAKGYRWDGEAWIGGDINRLVIKSEGEGEESAVGDAEVQALYSRAIGPYFDVQAGIRYDLEPSPNRTYAVVGFEGIAPYWFDTDGAIFVSNKGDVSARLSGSYDSRLTQRLILQPRAEINLAVTSVPERGIGSGVTDVGVGLRLRYEIRRQFAPYVGVSYESKVGDTADYARADGEYVGSVRVLFGVRAWF